MSKKQRHKDSKEQHKRIVSFYEGLLGLSQDEVQDALANLDDNDFLEFLKVLEGKLEETVSQQGRLGKKQAEQEALTRALEDEQNPVKKSKLMPKVQRSAAAVEALKEQVEKRLTLHSHLTAPVREGIEARDAMRARKYDLYAMLHLPLYDIRDDPEAEDGAEDEYYVMGSNPVIDKLMANYMFDACLVRETMAVFEVKMSVWDRSLLTYAEGTDQALIEKIDRNGNEHLSMAKKFIVTDGSFGNYLFGTEPDVTDLRELMQGPLATVSRVMNSQNSFPGMKAVAALNRVFSELSERRAIRSLFDEAQGLWSKLSQLEEELRTEGLSSFVPKQYDEDDYTQKFVRGYPHGLKVDLEGAGCCTQCHEKMLSIGCLANTLGEVE